MKKNRGFTLVETLIAIIILTSAILGATKAIQTSISSYIQSKDQVIAFYLAQEAFEQIRNIRDQNALVSQNWLTGLAQASSDPCYFGNYCYVEPALNPVPRRCYAGQGTCPLLRQDLVSGFMGYNTDWSETVFTREIFLKSINTNEISVNVVVYWTKGTSNRQFQAKEILTSWQRTEN